MKSKEVKNWRQETALERYRMIVPLLDPDRSDPAETRSAEKECQADNTDTGE